MNRYSVLCFIAASICFLLASPVLSGEVFVLGGPTIGTQDRIYSFNWDGTYAGATEGPAPNVYMTVTVGGASLYVGDFAEGTIERFDVSGSYVGAFADVASDLLGLWPLNIECDSGGNLYAHNAGYGSEPRNAGRYDLSSGILTQTYAHPDLVFPGGIDADGNGNVYIVNSASVGVGDRVYKFSADGVLLDTFDPDLVSNPSDISIDEQNAILYMADEWGGAAAVHAYSIEPGSFGQHLETITVPGADGGYGIQYEPWLGHLFVASTIGMMGGGSAFEIDLTSGNVIHTYTPPDALTVQDVVYVPEPATLGLLSLGGLLLLRRRK